MGWSAAFTAFERSVIDCYDSGKMDSTALSLLMEPYRGTDIDSGGERGLESHDGKGVKQIVIETWGLSMPMKPTPDQEKVNDYAWEDFFEEVWSRFYKVTEHFGWR